MDFRQAYHQISVRPDNTDLLTFVIYDVVDVLARNWVKLMSSMDFRAACYKLPVRPDSPDVFDLFEGKFWPQIGGV